MHNVGNPLSLECAFFNGCDITQDQPALRVSDVFSFSRHRFRFERRRKEEAAIRCPGDRFRSLDVSKSQTLQRYTNDAVIIANINVQSFTTTVTQDRPHLT